MSTFLHTSQRGALRALAGQGIFAVECHAQLRALLLQRLGPEHAALLAEPQHDPERRSVDWYTDADGPAVPVSQLPPDEAEALRDKAGALARDIQSLANQLDAEGHNAALSGQLLALALRHPADDDLWSVNGQPVLTNWGFAPGAVGAQPQDLTRLGAFAPAPAPAAAPAAAVAAPVAAAPAAELPVLCGTMEHNGVYLALFRHAGETLVCAAGDSCGGYTVVSVYQDGAQLEKDGICAAVSM